MGTHWAVILADSAAGISLAVAAVAARFAQVSNRKSVAVASTMATVELERRHAERIPRLTARLERWGTGSDHLFLSVWLESSEALKHLRVLIREARNMDSPIGFKPGQDGVANDLPWPSNRDLIEGLLPAWRADSLRPLADCLDPMPPGTSAAWLVQLRHTADMAGGCAAIRLKALCTAHDGAKWEVPVPVTISDKARELINDACKHSDR